MHHTVDSPVLRRLRSSSGFNCGHYNWNLTILGVCIANDVRGQAGVGGGWGIGRWMVGIAKVTSPGLGCIGALYRSVWGKHLSPLMTPRNSLSIQYCLPFWQLIVSVPVLMSGLCLASLSLSASLSLLSFVAHLYIFTSWSYSCCGLNDKKAIKDLYLSFTHEHKCMRLHTHTHTYMSSV